MHITMYTFQRCRNSIRIEHSSSEMGIGMALKSNKSDILVEHCYTINDKSIMPILPQCVLSKACSIIMLDL